MNEQRCRCIITATGERYHHAGCFAFHTDEAAGHINGRGEPVRGMWAGPVHEFDWRRAQLVKFHKVMGQPVLSTPAVPAEDRVRLRAALIAEEFLEVMEALFDTTDTKTVAGMSFLEIKNRMPSMFELAPIRVDMPALADGLADLDYVIEGTRLEFGIDGKPIADEVHRSNMQKVSGPVAPNGKRLKPEGWTPPDIEGELRKQGA
jgi:predicted HAD superfamily Cof-like phosphohydrolase